MIEPAGLHLRFRDDAATSGSSEPPDVAAFVRAPSTRAPREEFAVLPGSRAVDAGEPIVVFLQQAEFGIPAPGYDASLPDLESWSVQATKFGWIATVAPPARGPGPWRAARVIAGCLALTLPIPALALAAPASPAPAGPTSPPAAAMASPTSAPAAAKANPTTPAPASSSAPVVPAPTAAPVPAPAPAAGTKPEWTPGVMPPPPSRVQDSKALADAAWAGVDGIVVTIELKGGKSLHGRVGAVQADTFTFIDGDDGQILVIPKSGVASLRAYVPPPLPTQTGGGLIAGGSVLTGIGVPVFITGIAFVAICPDCIYLHLPMLVVGGGAIGGGIPMISKGMQRRSAFQRAVEERRISPVVTRTPYQGWYGGLQVRF